MIPEAQRAFAGDLDMAMLWFYEVLEESTSKSISRQRRRSDRSRSARRRWVILSVQYWTPAARTCAITHEPYIDASKMEGMEARQYALLLSWLVAHLTDRALVFGIRITCDDNVHWQ